MRRWARNSGAEKKPGAEIKIHSWGREEERKQALMERQSHPTAGRRLFKSTRDSLEAWFETPAVNKEDRL